MYAREEHPPPGSCSPFGRPSPALLARADRSYARFLAQVDPDDRPSDHDQDDAVMHR
ncbi:hypothetical protein AB0L74_34530 [Streptomyces sp. NPDC052020]|uniref:hypothetical protein n=1 Tax=Streptomyces sp. NPDC052020 TaxID=3155677 RepID=UPI003443B4C5